MANYATLIAAIQETIAANGNNEITGPILQQVLVSITNALGSGYQFIGIATPETTPGTPDQRVFYIGASGTYPNFGPAVIPDGNLAIFYYNSSWHYGSVAFPLGDGAVTTSKMANGAVTEQKLAEDVIALLGRLTLIDKAALDFGISDPLGNLIVKFLNGHIVTKNFDSQDVPTRQEVEDSHPVETGNDDASDFAISDPNGKQIVKFWRGHIVTKNFNSENISTIENVTSIYQQQNNPFGFESAKYFRRSAFRKDFSGYAPLIIVAGQSNADGRIPYTSAPSWLANNNYAINNYMVWDTASETFKTYNVRGMTGNGGAIAGTDGTGENKFAFDAFFAHSFLSQYGGSLYLVRQTLGGIGLQAQPTTGTRNWTWQPDIDNIVAGCNSMCLALMEKVNAAYNYAKRANLKLVPIAILWHQGENDATADRITYFKQNLSNLISWMRGLFLAPTLPFINADVNGSYGTYYAQVNSIFRELNAADEYMKTVDMTGHSTTMDNVHFDLAATQYMGEQMFNLYQQFK